MKLFFSIALTLAAVAAIFLVGYAFIAAGRLPEREKNPELHGWHAGSERPPSYLIGKDLQYLTWEIGPGRWNSQTAYYLIRGGLGGWYLSCGYKLEDDLLVGLPDAWIEYPEVKP